MLDAGGLGAVHGIAAASQTVRNATQRELTTTLGTAGATHVRFLFGLPFAALFLVVVVIASGQALPRPPMSFWPWVLAGALAQIAATALMLAAMNDRSFVVVYAYIKTEPVEGRIVQACLLQRYQTLPMARRSDRDRRRRRDGAQTRHDAGAACGVLGLAAGSMFALSAVGYRGAS